MSVKNTISITEARKRIFELAEDVQRPGAYFTLTENGRPKAVLMSANEFESWQETMEVSRDFPNLANDVAEAEKQYKNGEYKKWSSLLDLKKDWGFAVADKPTKKYGVHRSNKAKSAKKPK